MNDQQAEEMIRLLHELRDGQQLQLERQAQAMQRQEDLLAQQRERQAASLHRSGETEQLFASTSKLVARASVLAFVVYPIVVIVLMLVLWMVLARATPWGAG
jgi:hypothetical protein